MRTKFPVYLWEIEADAFATLCQLPLRVVQIEIVERGGKQIVVCTGVDTRSDPVSEDAPARRLVMQNVFEAKALVWAVKQEEPAIAPGVETIESLVEPEPQKYRPSRRKAVSS